MQDNTVQGKKVEVIIINEDDNLVLKGQSGKIGEGVSQDGLRKILHFYEQSL